MADFDGKALLQKLGNKYLGGSQPSGGSSATGGVADIIAGGTPYGAAAGALDAIQSSSSASSDQTVSTGGARFGNVSFGGTQTENLVKYAVIGIAVIAIGVALVKRSK